MQIERQNWPKTVGQAARQIIAGLDDKSRAHLRTMDKRRLIKYHRGWGMGIRNDFGLWRGNTTLLKSCGKGKLVHPDSCSMTIIYAVWQLLQDPESSLQK